LLNEKEEETLSEPEAPVVEMTQTTTSPEENFFTEGEEVEELVDMGNAKETIGTVPKIYKDGPLIGHDEEFEENDEDDDEDLDGSDDDLPQMKYALGIDSVQVKYYYPYLVNTMEEVAVSQLDSLLTCSPHVRKAIILAAVLGKFSSSTQSLTMDQLDQWKEIPKVEWMNPHTAASSFGDTPYGRIYPDALAAGGFGNFHQNALTVFNSKIGAYVKYPKQCVMGNYTSNAQAYLDFIKYMGVHSPKLIKKMKERFPYMDPKLNIHSAWFKFFPKRIANDVNEKKDSGIKGTVANALMVYLNFSSYGAYARPPVMAKMKPVNPGDVSLLIENPSATGLFALLHASAGGKTFLNTLENAVDKYFTPKSKHSLVTHLWAGIQGLSELYTRPVYGYYVRFEEYAKIFEPTIKPEVLPGFAKDIGFSRVVNILMTPVASNVLMLRDCLTNLVRVASTESKRHEEFLRSVQWDISGGYDIAAQLDLKASSIELTYSQGRNGSFKTSKEVSKNFPNVDAWRLRQNAATLVHSRVIEKVAVLKLGIILKIATPALTKNAYFNIAMSGALHPVTKATTTQSKQDYYLHDYPDMDSNFPNLVDKTGALVPAFVVLASMKTFSDKQGLIRFAHMEANYHLGVVLGGINMFYSYFLVGVKREKPLRATSSQSIYFINTILYERTRAAITTYNGVFDQTHTIFKNQLHNLNQSFCLAQQRDTMSDKSVLDLFKYDDDKKSKALPMISAPSIDVTSANFTIQAMSQDDIDAFMA